MDDLYDLELKVEDVLSPVELEVDDKVQVQSGGGGLNEEEVRAIVSEETADLQPLTEIDASVDEEAFTLTLLLKDKNGEELSSKTVTLPSKNGLPDLSDYVKNTDYSTFQKAGVGKSSFTYGVSTTEGYFSVAKATKDEILVKNSGYKPIVPNTLDYAVKVGITTNTETLTDEEKAAALAWLGVDTLIDELRAEIAALKEQ